MKTGSVHLKVKKIRSSTAYKKWRDEVFKKCENKCVLCGSKKCLEADHIEPVSLFPNKAFEVNNGRVLCNSCHKKTDTYGNGARFFGEPSLHPILIGDVAHKINLLPKSIEMGGKIRGLEIKYNSNTKKWTAGYWKLKSNGESVEECLDALFFRLKRLSTFGFSLIINQLNNKRYMAQKSSAVERKELYSFLEREIVKRELLPKERQEVSRIFRQAVRKVVESILEAH